MDKTTRAHLKSVGARTLIVVGDILLSGFLMWETWVLIQKYKSVKDSLAGSILAVNPEAFAEQLKSQLPDNYVWIMVIGGLVVTLSLLLGMFLTRGTLNKIVTRINAIWIIAWLLIGLYLVFVTVALIIAFRGLLG